MEKLKTSLIQENLLLKVKVLLKSGELHQKSELPLEVENEFLKQILKYEEAEVIPMYQYLNIAPDTFPPENTLNDEELEMQFKRLEQLLNKHNIVIDLVDGLPLCLAYKFITEEAMLEEYQFIEDVTLHLDGCGGWCPDCFQADYCTTKDDIWSEEELEQERRKNKSESD